jgi:hypothetical protein
MCIFFFFKELLLARWQHLFEVGFSDTNSVISIGLFCEFLPFILALALGYFKLSFEECIEFTIFGLKTNVVHGLLSFHHLENSEQSLRQHLQQQQ